MKVYKVVAVLLNAGDQFPVIPLFDVVGNALKEAPEHIAATCEKVGATSGSTVIVPVVVALPHPPVKVTVYGNEPEAVGVPEIVTALAAHEPETPAGKPVTVAPVALVVAKVIVVIAVLIHVVLLIPDATVFNGVTVIVPVVVTVPHPPVKVTV